MSDYFQERERIMLDWRAEIERQESAGRYRPSVRPLLVGFAAAFALVTLVRLVLL